MHRGSWGQCFAAGRERQVCVPCLSTRLRSGLVRYSRRQGNRLRLQIFLKALHAHFVTDTLKTSFALARRLFKRLSSRHRYLALQSEFGKGSPERKDRRERILLAHAETGGQ